MPEHILTVDPQNRDLRLDVFLVKNIGNSPSRRLIKDLIDTGGVRVNEKQTKAHYKVCVADKITVRIPETDETAQDIKPENIPLDIFYEDKILLVINKPAGMMVHPARGKFSGTLVNALLSYCETLSDIDTSRPGIVHRLDRETSGLMLVAKDDKTHRFLARQFKKHRIKKCYGALVKGDIEFDEGVIDVPIGRHPRHWDKRAVFSDASAELSGCKEAETLYRVLKRFDGRMTCVSLFPQSGRTHQLRVHMAHLGHPILGDAKYGSKDSFGRLCLHARSIGFQHPVTRRFVEFSSPMPHEFLNGA